MQTELQTLIATLEAAFDGDSNDAEHDAAYALVEYVKDKVTPLIDNARDVINNWEHGDLAAAVRDLDGALGDLGYSKDASTDTRSAAEQLLDKAAQQQTDFWETLSQLEAELGIEIESTSDLQGMTVDDLRETYGEEDNETEEQSNG